MLNNRITIELERLKKLIQFTAFKDIRWGNTVNDFQKKID